jgi:hypothetical protein
MVPALISAVRVPVFVVNVGLTAISTGCASAGINTAARHYRALRRSALRFARSRRGVLRLWLSFIVADTLLALGNPIMAVTLFAAAVSLRGIMHSREARIRADRSRARLLMSWS